MTRATRVSAIIVVAAVTVVPVSAQEPESAPATPVLGSAAARFGPGSSGSLAEVARRLRLARPDEGQGLEVNDLNLGVVAAEGRISVTEGVAAVPAPRRPAAAETGETAVEDWEKRYTEQADAVKAAEDRVAEIDRFRTETRDPYLGSRTPHSQAPGVISEGQVQRDEAARAAAEERARLDALRQEGRRLGANR